MALQCVRERELQQSGEMTLSLTADIEPSRHFFTFTNMSCVCIAYVRQPKLGFVIMKHTFSADVTHMSKDLCHVLCILFCI